MRNRMCRIARLCTVSAAMVSLVATGCASMMKPVMKIAPSQEPARVLGSALVEPNMVEEGGIVFEPSKLSEKCELYSNLTVSQELRSMKLDKNMVYAITSSGNKTMATMVRDSVEALRNPLTVDFLHDDLLREEKTVFKDISAKYRLMDFQWLMPSAIGAKTIKPGDEWKVVDKKRTKKGAILVMQEGAVDVEFLASHQRFKFSGIVEDSGKRYAIIDVDQALWFVDMNAHDMANSTMYLNQGKLRLAYDYVGKKVVEASFDGRFNTYINGAIDLPIRALSTPEMQEKIQASLNQLEQGNKFVRIANVGGGSLLGMAGAVAQQKALKKMHEATSKMTDEILMILSDDDIPAIIQVMLDSNIYTLQYEKAVPYRAFFIDK